MIPNQYPQQPPELVPVIEVDPMIEQKLKLKREKKREYDQRRRSRLAQIDHHPSARLRRANATNDSSVKSRSSFSWFNLNKDSTQRKRRGSTDTSASADIPHHHNHHCQHPQHQHPHRQQYNAQQQYQQDLLGSYARPSVSTPTLFPSTPSQPEDPQLPSGLHAVQSGPQIHSNSSSLGAELSPLSMSVPTNHSVPTSYSASSSQSIPTSHSIPVNINSPPISSPRSTRMYLNSHPAYNIRRGRSNGSNSGRKSSEPATGNIFGSGGGGIDGRGFERSGSIDSRAGDMPPMDDSQTTVSTTSSFSGRRSSTDTFMSMEYNLRRPSYQLGIETPRLDTPTSGTPIMDSSPHDSLLNSFESQEQLLRNEQLAHNNASPHYSTGSFELGMPIIGAYNTAASAHSAAPSVKSLQSTHSAPPMQSPLQSPMQTHSQLHTRAHSQSPMHNPQGVLHNSSGGIRRMSSTVSWGDDPYSGEPGTEGSYNADSYSSSLPGRTQRVRSNSQYSQHSQYSQFSHYSQPSVHDAQSVYSENFQDARSVYSAPQQEESNLNDVMDSAFLGDYPSLDLPSDSEEKYRPQSYASNQPYTSQLTMQLQAQEARETEEALAQQSDEQNQYSADQSERIQDDQLNGVISEMFGFGIYEDDKTV